MFDSLCLLLFQDTSPSGKRLFANRSDLGRAIFSLAKADSRDVQKYQTEESAIAAVNAAFSGKKPFSPNLRSGILAVAASRIALDSSGERARILTELDHAIVAAGVERDQWRLRSSPPALPAVTKKIATEGLVRMHISPVMHDVVRLRLGEKERIEQRWKPLIQTGDYIYRATYCFSEESVARELWTLYYMELKECVRQSLEVGTFKFGHGRICMREITERAAQEKDRSLDEEITVQYLSWLSANNMLRLLLIRPEYCLSPLVISNPYTKPEAHHLYIMKNGKPKSYLIPARDVSRLVDLYDRISRESTSGLTNDIVLRQCNFSDFEVQIVRGY
jgi:hypothetical protein